MLLHFPSVSLPIYYSLITLPLDNICELLDTPEICFHPDEMQYNLEMSNISKLNSESNMLQYQYNIAPYKIT